jgi:hypothetical protein
MVDIGYSNIICDSYLKNGDFCYIPIEELLNSPLLKYITEMETLRSRMKQFQRLHQLDIGSLVYYDVKRYI